jgi:hypothetical protein
MKKSNNQTKADSFQWIFPNISPLKVLAALQSDFNASRLGIQMYIPQLGG